MNTSDVGLKLIRTFEGLRLKAYRCPAEIWTIGYGHTTAAGPPEVREGMRITAAEAESILKRDLERFEAAVSAMVKVPLTQAQFDVLVSFAFNCGTAALQRSTLLKRVNASAFDAVPAELMKWTKADGRELPGLVRRRRAEAALWRGLPKRVDAGEARTAPDAPQPPKPITRSREANAAILAGGAGAVAAATEAMPVVREGVGIMPVLSEALGKPALIAALIVMAAALAIWVWRRQRLQEQRMMLAWILSPTGRWLSLVGAVFAALGVAWLKGRAAGRAAWEARRQAAKARSITTSSEIRHDVQTDSDAALDRRLDRWMRD